MARWGCRDCHTRFGAWLSRCPRCGSAKELVVALNACTSCTTKFAVGLPKCPHCGSTEYVEDGAMAKITAHGGPSDKTLPDAVVQTDAVLTEQQAEELREAVDSDAEPLPFEASVEPTAPEEDEGEEPQIGNDFSASPEESEPEPGYEEWTVEQLKEELAVRDLPKSGKRDDLVQRLRDADAAAQDSE